MNYAKWIYCAEADRWWLRRGDYLALVTIRKSRRWSWQIKHAPYQQAEWPEVVSGRAVGRKAFDKARAALERVSAK